jgi:dextranase
MHHPLRIRGSRVVAICHRILWLCIALAASVPAAAIEITDLYTDKVRYDPGQPVTIEAILENSSASPWPGIITLDIWRLDVKTHTETKSLTVPGSGTVTTSFTWTPPPDASGNPLDFVGYLVRVAAGAQARFTAIDVSSDWRRFPRYGFLTTFQKGVSPADREAQLNKLARDYHLNALQFYDWMWRHENVIAKDASGGMADIWQDWTGTDLSSLGILDFVKMAHARNMAALPYFQIYVALDKGGDSVLDYLKYSGVQPSWRLFYKDTHNVKQDYHRQATMGDPLVTTLFCTFNPLNKDWQHQIVAQTEAALTLLLFDGIHFDQLDKPDDFNGWCDDNGDPLYLNTGFAPIITQTHAKFASVAPTPGIPRAMTFNLVDGKIDYWHVNDIVWNSEVNFLYTEIWNSKTYADLHSFIRWAREESRGKPIVVAAYMNSEDNIPFFEERSVRLADAAIFASGGFHIELGDGGQMLSEPFFRSRKKLMSTNLKKVMRDYYNFAAAYEDILSFRATDEDKDVLLRRDLFYGDRGLQWIEIAGKDVYGEGVENAIWYLSRRNADYEVIHLINLPDDPNSDYVDPYGYWRDPIGSPLPVHAGLQVKYWGGPHFNIKGVFLASPDFNGGLSQSLPFSNGTDARGSYVSFTVPQLEYWDMIYIQRQIKPLGQRYEAENGILYAKPPSLPASYPRVESTLPDHSGTGYVTFSGSTPPSSSVSFWISVPSHSGYALEMRYANSGSDLMASAFVDGNYAGSFSLPKVNTGFTWATADVNVHLRPGPHQVVVVPPSQPLQVDFLQPCLPINGLKGEYFGKQDLTEIAFTRTDRTVHFDWQADSPAPPSLATFFPKDHFSARWTGMLAPPTKADYKFVVIADDGVRLFVDGVLVIDDWAVAATPLNKRRESMLVTLDPKPAKPKFSIDLYYFENAGMASVQLLWSAAAASGFDLPEQVIAEDYLFPSPWEPDPGLGVAFRRGDANGNGDADISDVVTIFNLLHAGGAVSCEDACDVDDNGVVNDADAQALLDYLYQGSGVPPVCPFPYCGRDLTDDKLTCASSSCQ